MTYDPRFGPAAQTPQQRAYVLHQLKVTFPRLATRAPALSQPLFDRYVAGELTWTEVRRHLNETTAAVLPAAVRRGA